MSAELRLRFDPELPEWRRSGRFFAIALALHLGILAWPCSQGHDALPPMPLSVRLIEALKAAPQPLPVSPPPQPSAPAKPATPRPTAQKTTPLLAMPPEQQPSATTPVAAAAPAPLPAAPAAGPASIAPAAAAPLVAARYNAAYLNNPEPKYPPLSRRLGEEGKVLLKVRVTADGLAASVELEKSSNFARLDEAARQAVTGWRFVPARRGDEAIEASVIVPVVFRLDS
ncbi:MAG TPA: energy transducer TonB [Azonexus sp.]